MKKNEVKIRESIEIIKHYVKAGYPIEHPDITERVLDVFDWEISDELLIEIYTKAEDEL